MKAARTIKTKRIAPCCFVGRQTAAGNIKKSNVDLKKDFCNRAIRDRPRRHIKKKRALYGGPHAKPPRFSNDESTLCLRGGVDRSGLQQRRFGAAAGSVRVDVAAGA